MSKKKPQIQKPSKGRIVIVQNGAAEMVGMIFNIQPNGLIGVKAIDESGRDHIIQNIPHKDDPNKSLDDFYWDWPKRV